MRLKARQRQVQGERSQGHRRHVGRVEAEFSCRLDECCELVAFGLVVS
jgi:hypothetical protein